MDKNNRFSGTSAPSTHTAGKLQPSGRSGYESGLSRPGRAGAFGGGNPFQAAAYNNPFAFMRRLMEDMDRTFGDFTQGGWPAGEGTAGLALGARLFSPQVEVFERDGRLTVRADLPGMKPEDVHVHLEDDVLTISGERRHEGEQDREGVWHSERAYGSFHRSVQLPAGIDPESVQAAFEHGVLEVSLPRPQQKPKGRRIDIGAGNKTAPGTPDAPATSGVTATSASTAQPGTGTAAPAAKSPAPAGTSQGGSEIPVTTPDSTATAK